MHVAQLISESSRMLSTVYWDCAPKTPSGPEEVKQGPGVSSSDYGPLSVLWRARLPSKVIRPLINKAFIKKYCAPRQAQGEAPQFPGDDQQRATDAPLPLPESTSAHLQRLEHCL